jgi:RNA polymerase sigma factor (sigma-70 family)
VDEQELQRLAVAAQRGDESAFEALVRGLTRTLVALAYRYTADWESARDLTQETWLRVYRNLGRWDPERSFTAWLYSIHRNGCRDQLRSPWLQRASGNAALDLEAVAAPQSDDPSAEVEAREFRERILGAAATLSPSQREVFLRVDLEDGDQKAVAEELGIRYGTLRVTLHAARRRLAELLEPMRRTT